MRPLTILCALSTLSTTLAVPFSQPSNSTSASKSTPSSTGSATLPSPTLSAPNSCPANKFKQCCTTLSQLGDSLLKPLGTIVPLVGAIQVNSLVGLSCKSMADKAPETDCADVVMCCDSSALAADNFMQTSCQDFAIAKRKEREAFERQQRRFELYQSMVMSESATPSPTPVGLMGSSVSRATATATRV
ncbi:hypothetical protein Aspvir_004716 [Aspergillus viridinutans]|uniref:Hydrophobin n=1 Tax=Aspergillus viridinutans TaxID=75553 RepID=A0A9P3F0T2_ASPVI|nr:uncharacterized protein Aspvir_004716 [Aspergillus viridinutans]GIK00689.1 hypothetical protein Aspvir_004716 [Aspergillus viridinutans]